MNFEINPCKAVMTKVKSSNCDINTMNNLCYGISKAYGDVYGSNVEDSLRKQCADMISDKKKENGHSDCYMKRPAPPPGFNQVSRFFPKLLQETNNPTEAYKKCCEMSKSTQYPNSSLEYCRLDADAVVTTSIEEYRRGCECQQGGRCRCMERRRQCGYRNYSKNLYFFVGIVFIVAIILFFVYTYKKSFIKNKFV